MEFSKVKDETGTKQTFSTGAQKERPPGKGRYDLVPAYPIKRLAQHYENGATTKYTPRNWERGLPLWTFLDSLERHLGQIKMGDTSEDHWAAVMWHACGFMWTQNEILQGRLPAYLAEGLPFSVSQIPESTVAISLKEKKKKEFYDSQLGIPFHQRRIIGKEGTLTILPVKDWAIKYGEKTCQKRSSKCSKNIKNPKKKNKSSEHCSRGRAVKVAPSKISFRSSHIGKYL